MTHLIAIGGSDAGISAALRARELDPTTDVTVVVADEYPNFSICGIPYYFTGEVAPWQSLAHRTSADLEATGMRLRLNTFATGIDVAVNVARGALTKIKIPQGGGCCVVVLGFLLLRASASASDSGDSAASASSTPSGPASTSGSSATSRRRPGANGLNAEGSWSASQPTWS